MFWILLWILVFSLVAWVLWAPIRLEINSVSGTYKITWWPVAAVHWLPETGLDVIDVQFVFFRKQIEMSKLGKRQKPSAPTPVAMPAHPHKPHKRTGLSFREVSRLAFGLVKTFHIRQCRIWWDTDDFLINAWLYPVAYLRKSGAVQVSINFQGRRDVVLVVENRLGRVLWQLTKIQIFNKLYKS